MKKILPVFLLTALAAGCASMESGSSGEMMMDSKMDSMGDDSMKKDSMMDSKDSDAMNKDSMMKEPKM